jgi:hypothetical protein
MIGLKMRSAGTDMAASGHNEGMAFWRPHSLDSAMSALCVPKTSSVLIT